MAPMHCDNFEKSAFFSKENFESCFQGLISMPALVPRSASSFAKSLRAESSPQNLTIFFPFGNFSKPLFKMSKTALGEMQSLGKSLAATGPDSLLQKAETNFSCALVQPERLLAHLGLFPHQDKFYVLPFVW